MKERLVSLLKQCGNERDLSRGRELHKAIRTSGYAQNVFIQNLLIQMYGKCGSTQEAKSVFDGIENPNLFSSNILFQAYARNGHLQDAWRIFRGMQQRDVVSWNAMATAYAQYGHLQEAVFMLERFPQWNVVCWSALITEFSGRGHVEMALSFFNRMYSRNEVSWNALIQGYAENGQAQQARYVFDKMSGWDVISWNIMFQAYTQEGELEKAIGLFSAMPDRNLMSWNAMIGAYVQNGQRQEAAWLFNEMPEHNIVAWNNMVVLQGKALFDIMPRWDIVSWNCLFKAFVEKGCLEEARDLFYSMPEKNLVTWSTMIDVFSQDGRLESAREAFFTMPARDIVAWNGIVGANAYNGHLSGTKSFSRKMPMHDVVTSTTLLAAYAQQGCMVEARELFERLPFRNVVSWNAMMQAYAQNGHGVQALELYREMEVTGVKPDEASFKSVLAACNHLGLLQECWERFISMVSDHGLAPLSEHYNCMVDLLGRAGQLDRAEQLIHTMPFLPSGMAWSTLLGSCKLHRDVERAARVAEYVLSTDTVEAAPYILLANAYASVSRTQDMAAVRRRMENRGVKKLAGFSVIEIGNDVHRFVAGDGSHPRTPEILTELNRLSNLAKEAGYVPDTGEVLHDVREEEKEGLVGVHSERLAIALGLISLNPDLPVRVLKNLRICSDCHSLTKFIAKVSRRRIVVRDAFRFHCFENGTCSCQDYW